MHDGYENRYSFVMNNRKVVLASLKPLQAYEDQMGIGRECKLRDKSVRKRKVRKRRGWRGKRRGVENRREWCDKRRD